MTGTITRALLSIPVAVGMVAFSLTGHAASMTFDDRATFLAAGTSSSSAGIAIEQVGGSTLVASALYSTIIDDGWAISGVENFDINITVPTEVYGFGMDVHEPIASTATLDGCNVGTCVQSTFTVALYNGVTLVDTVQFSPDDDTLAFFGVTSTDLFNRLEIRETTGTNDNEIFGRFVTTASPVPLPAAAWLFGSALFGLMAIARRRQAL